MSRLCLTFDNGPHPVGTPLVLDVLERQGVRATFFALGKNLESREGRDLARRVVEAGHALGHHTYSHEIPLGTDPRPDAVDRELARTHELLDGLWRGRRRFRPFGGRGAVGPHLLSPEAIAWLGDQGYDCVLWSSVPGDFSDPVGWVERALTDLESRDEVLMVLHDHRPEAMQRLDGFLTEAKARGHTFTPDIPQSCLLMEAGHPTVDLTPYVGAPAA